jgi:ATP-binding cassette subfamily B protein
MPWIVVVPLLSFAAVALRPVAAFATSRLSDELQLATSLRILEHAAGLDLAFFEDPANQDMLARTQANSARHMEALVRDLAALVRHAIQLVTLLLIILLIEPVVVAALAVLALPYLWYQSRLSRTHYWIEHNREGRRRWTRYFSNLLMSHGSVPEVKLLDLAPHLVARFRALMEKIRDQNRAIYRRRAVGGLVFGLLGGIVIYAAVFHLADEALRGEATLGSVAAYLLAVERFAATVTGLVNLIAQSIHSSLMVSNLIAFLGITPTATAPPTEGGPPSIRGKIEFRDVSFRYPGSEERALEDVSLAIEPGEVVALVGPNGAGKSTLVKLLGRLYEPEQGTILLDSHKLSDFAPEDLRSRLSFVFQQFARYEATAGENIAYGDWRRLGDDSEAIEEIAERTGAAEMISRLPNGYDTHLGRAFGHTTLSAGQWQLLAMARAFARDANILVLDEPTSNLDARTEYDVFSRFRKLARGRTTLLISHRFTTVGMADRILVLEAGRLVEEGTHGDLLAGRGVYARLYELHRRLYEIRQAGESVMTHSGGAASPDSRA